MLSGGLDKHRPKFMSKTNYSWWKLRYYKPDTITHTYPTPPLP